MCSCKHHYLRSAPCTCTCDSHKDARKVEPEWVVGQQVSGSDYTRLPMESRVQIQPVDEDFPDANPEWTKIAPKGWNFAGANANHDLSKLGHPRTLTHLPTTQPEAVTTGWPLPNTGGPRQNLIPNPAFKVGTDGWATQPEDTETFFWDKATGKPCPRRGNLLCALPHDADHRHEHRAEPEDATDAYVEPEPLKEGEVVLVWAKVLSSVLDEDGEVFITTLANDSTLRHTYASPDAIVRPDAGQVPPWVKEREEIPVTVTISGTRIFSEESGAPMVRLETGPGSYALIPIANISSITEGGAS